MGKTIKFSDIKKLFPSDKWDLGFLTEEQLKQCAYSPIKGKAQEYGADFTNNIHFLSIVNSVVFARYSPDSWDYSLYTEVDGILKKSGLTDWFPIYTNFKMAAILAGLGVRAKNSLVYGYKFGFDMKVCVIGFDDKITGCQAPERLDLGYWERCEGCSDCRLACPAGAIHNEKEPYWIDSGRCDDFIGFGDHPRIPSIKKFWHKHVHPEVPRERVERMTSCTDLGGELVFDANGYTLDKYLHEQASQDVRKRIATVFVLTEAHGNAVIGYYTLTSGSVDLVEWPEALKKKPPLYPVVPVTLLGRLALDKRHQGKGLREYLLMDALWRCSAVAREFASLAIIVDAIDDKARRFYEHYGFCAFPKQADRLFLHMQTIQELLKP